MSRGCGGVLGRPVGIGRHHALQLRSRGPVDELPSSVDGGPGTGVAGPVRLEDGERLLRALGGVASDDAQVIQREREVTPAGRHTRIIADSEPLTDALMPRRPRARADVIALDNVKAEGSAAADWTGERHRSNSPNPVTELVAQPTRGSPQGCTRIFTAVSLWLIRVSSPWSTTSARSMREVMNGLRSTLPSWTSLMVSGWSLT